MNIPKKLYQLAKALHTTEEHLLDGIELMSSDFDFTREERRLVKMYRSLPPAKKQTIYSLVLWLSKEGGMRNDFR